MVLKGVGGGNWIAAADRYLEECFAAGTPPHVNELAHQAGISPRSLRRAFTAEARMGIASYFKHARIRHAQELLASSDLPLNDIAHHAGFGTRVTFFRAFKRATGMTPDEFRASHRRR